MRKDMAKVVTERPRRGGKYADKNAGQTRGKIQPESDFFYDEVADTFTEDYDDIDPGPRRISAGQKPYGWNAKEFSDLLNPLRRYLQKQVGRPWNDVYSELSQTLDRRSMAGQHIWSHVTSEVTTNCIRYGDKLYSVRWGLYEVDGLYVDPDTGILRDAGKSWYGRHRRAKYVDPEKANKHKADGNEYEKIEGIWYQITQRPVHVTEWMRLTEYIPPGASTVSRRVKRQLNSKELKKLSLVNH